MSITAAPDQVALLLAELRRQIRVLRIGPVCDGDPGLEAMIAVARAKGWAVLDRFVADGYVLDMAGGKVAGTWPRSSTLKKNRFRSEEHTSELQSLMRNSYAVFCMKKTTPYTFVTPPQTTITQ